MRWALKAAMVPLGTNRQAAESGWLAWVVYPLFAECQLENEAEKPKVGPASRSTRSTTFN